MIIAVRAIFIALLIHCHVLAERLLTLLTYESHFHSTFQRVGRNFSMAFGAVEPFLTTRRTDGNLRIQNMLATQSRDGGIQQRIRTTGFGCST